MIIIIIVIIIITIIIIIIIIIIVWSVYSKEILLKDYNAITWERYNEMVLFRKYNWDHKKCVDLVFSLKFKGSLT